jgi:transposase-like protein
MIMRRPRSCATTRRAHQSKIHQTSHSSTREVKRQAKAAAKITDDEEELLAFYDYPCEHWVHLRTTNPIESTFATVRHRTKITKGPGSRAAGLAMAFKLIESAQDRWRAVNAPHLVALVRAGATFINGKLVERPGEEAQAEAA